MSSHTVEVHFGGKHPSRRSGILGRGVAFESPMILVSLKCLDLRQFDGDNCSTSAEMRPDREPSERRKMPRKSPIRGCGPIFSGELSAAMREFGPELDHLGC